MYQRRNSRVFQSLEKIQQYNLPIFWHQMGQGLTELFVINGDVHSLNIENLARLFRLACPIILRGQHIKHSICQGRRR